MELDTKLRDNFGSGIRNRIFFYFIISLINTFIVEAFMFYNFKLVAEYMSEVEYVNTGYIAEPQIAEWQVAVMIILGIIVFMASFMLLIENIISYINEMTKSVRRIAAGDLNEVMMSLHILQQVLMI